MRMRPREWHPEEWSSYELAGISERSMATMSMRTSERWRVIALIGRSLLWFCDNGEEKKSVACRDVLRQISLRDVDLIGAYEKAEHFRELLEQRNPLLAKEIGDACTRYRATRGLRSDACLHCYREMKPRAKRRRSARLTSLRSRP